MRRSAATSPRVSVLSSVQNYVFEFNVKLLRFSVLFSSAEGIYSGTVVTLRYVCGYDTPPEKAKKRYDIILSVFLYISQFVQPYRTVHVPPRNSFLQGLVGKSSNFPFKLQIARP